MAIQKREYELSIWNEKLIDGIKQETKGIIIGAHDMSYLGRATAIKLTKYIKGTNSLTFQMPTKFFNSETGEYEKNEFIDDLYNERKLKLHYKGKWYEFYVKQIKEDKLFKAIMKTFTCTDSFIDELSRTGYELEFAPELNNSVEEIGTFTEEIIEDSIWDYTPEYNWGNFTEFKEERFYKIPLSQFSGGLMAARLDLNVYKNEIKNEDEIPQIENFHTHERRDLQYGDDLARRHQLFWDNHAKDNGRILFNNSKEIKGDYIYVPISQLSYIYGSVYNTDVEIDTPAYYGSYNSQNKRYALQPKSKNPKDLIQFIYFENGDDVYIDEENTIVNDNCTYIMTIEDWNKALANRFSSKDTFIYWQGRAAQEDKKSKRYTINTDGDMWYTTGVKCKSSIVDDFVWYPVYADGFLDEINGQEVLYARKIIISDRTELNINNDIYTTVYKNNANEYEYSDEELNDLVINGQDFRVVSKDDTYEVLPTLARNLIQNGINITDSIGWESKTQNNNDLDIIGTGSFKKLMELSVKAYDETGHTIEISKIKGDVDEEKVSNYFLEILSPLIEKTDNFNLVGQIETDYAINFGITGQEKKIEKGKVYAIRMKTIEYDNEGNKIEKLNVDLDRVIIGEGSTNSKGNYIIDGIDNDDGNFIKFSNLRNLNFLNEEPIEDASYDKTLYRYNDNGTWKWNVKYQDNKTNIKDDCFVLFKADKTINNPYVGIRVESEPLEIEANSLIVQNYTLNDGSGAKICIIAPKNSDAWATIKEDIAETYRFVQLADNEKIVFCEVNPMNFSEDFLNRCNYDKETGIVNITSNLIELNDGDFIETGITSSAKGVITESIYCTTIGGNNGDDKSRAVAVFLQRDKNDGAVENQFYGVFWFEKITGEANNNG